MSEDLEHKAEVEPVFKRIWVKLGYGRGEEFDVPRGIVNFYDLEEGDGLYCKLLKLKDESKKEIEIGEDVLIDIIESDADQGRFPNSLFELYNMEDYSCALLEIKKIIKQR